MSSLGSKKPAAGGAGASASSGAASASAGGAAVKAAKASLRQTRRCVFAPCFRGNVDGIRPVNACRDKKGSRSVV